MLPDDESVQESAKGHCVFVYFLINWMHRKQIQAKPAERNRRELYRMGLIKAIAGAAGGVMADQWKEYFY